MADWTYGDEPAEPEFGEGSNPGNGTVTYTYYTDAACTTQTTPAENGAEENGGKPTYAGTYYVKAEVAAADGYNAAKRQDFLYHPAENHRHPMGSYRADLHWDRTGARRNSYRFGGGRLLPDHGDRSNDRYQRQSGE